MMSETPNQREFMNTKGIMTTENGQQIEHHYVYNMDCIELMRSWNNAFTPDLIFADPPFNIGESYDTHDDQMCSKQYSQFTDTWLRACVDMLRDGGVLAINTPDDLVQTVLNCVGAIEWGHCMKRIDWCIWHYRFGQCGRSKFISSHTHVLIFRKGKDAEHTFNSDDILVESLRSSKYNDPRTLESETPNQRVPLDVWCDIPRVVGNARERMPNHPNQLPERYLERVIKAYTNPNDFVFDPFGGSGTTSAICARYGRRSATCDVSARYCEDIRARIARELG